MVGTPFNREVDKFMLSKLTNFVSFGEISSHIWPLVAQAMGGDDAGYTADVVS